MNADSTEKAPTRFTPRAADYARIERGAVLRIMMPVFAMIVAGTAVGAIFDSRWLIVGLMLIFIVCPMAILLLWLRMTGRTDLRLRLRPQSWEISPEGVRISIYGFDEDVREAQAQISISEEEIESLEHDGSLYILRTTHPDAAALIAPDEHLDAESIKILSGMSYRNLCAKNAEDEDLA